MCLSFPGGEREQNDRVGSGAAAGTDTAKEDAPHRPKRRASTHFSQPALTLTRAPLHEFPLGKGATGCEDQILHHVLSASGLTTSDKSQCSRQSSSTLVRYHSTQT